jgi:hypothetical protein
MHRATKFQGCRPSLMALLLGITLAAGLSACGSETDRRVENSRPFVRLTGGPVERSGATNDSVGYSTEFLWTGWDEDGIIDHYQYAIDIPDHFSLEDINNPEDIGIAWKDTTAFRGRFLFFTPEQDTILNTDGTVTEPARYRGDHTFYVRAVDNEGAVSEAKWVTFTARTATPQTTFTVPAVALSGQPLNVGPRFSVSWTGFDPDNPDPRRRPAYYEWKLFEIPFVQRVSDVNYNIKDPNGEGYNVPWNRIGADTTRLTLNLNPPADYIFALRAVDEAGGTENKFFVGRNALLLASLQSNMGSPLLTITERSAGSFDFTGGSAWEIEAPTNQCMTFHFFGDPSGYGGVMQGYNYGIDVAEVDDEGPNSGFRGWTLIPYTYEPICFSTPGIHTLTIKARDTGGGVTVAQVLIRVISFPLDRDLLYVDDHRLNIGAQGVTDTKMDTQVMSMLNSVGYSVADGTLFVYEPWGPADLLSSPTTLRLSDLSRYKSVMWSVLGTGYNGNPALITANGCANGRILQSYLSAGGALWVYGQTVFGAFKKFPGGECKADVTYNDGTGLNYGNNDFITDFLHISGGDFRTVKNNPQSNGLIRARPSAKAIADNFPVLEVDSTLFTSTTIGGIPNIDGMFEPKFVPNLDSLYIADATARTNSSFRNKPVAFRYADPDPSPEQGPLAVMGFPLHFFKQGTLTGGTIEDRDNPADPLRGTGAKGLAAAVFRWFRQHGTVAQAALAPR